MSQPKAETPFPETIQLKVGGKTIELVKNKQTQALSGVSEKLTYRDPKTGDIYFVKTQKRRELTDFFSALGETEKKNLLAILSKKEHDRTDSEKARLEPYLKHMQDVQATHSYLEVLSSRVAEKMFGKDILIVPENYLYKDPNSNQVFILSKGVNEYKEFLSDNKNFNELLLKAKKIAKERGVKESELWDHSPRPSRSDLNLSEQEGEALGELLAVALVMGHLDLFNNINLSNSGTATDANNNKRICTVDWGNTAGPGFGGFSAEETAFKNPDFQEKKSLESKDSIGGFKHVVPFDKQIYTLLPRLIVPDLFKMPGREAHPDKISQAVLKGFLKVCEAAKALFLQEDNTVSEKVLEAIEASKSLYTDEGTRAYLAKLLESQKMYSTNAPSPQQYHLANIMEGRLFDLIRIGEKLKSKTLEEIAAERLNAVKAAQRTPKDTKEVKGLEIPPKPMTNAFDLKQKETPSEPPSPDDTTPRNKPQAG